MFGFFNPSETQFALSILKNKIKKNLLREITGSDNFEQSFQEPIQNEIFYCHIGNRSKLKFNFDSTSETYSRIGNKILTQAEGVALQRVMSNLPGIQSGKNIAEGIIIAFALMILLTTQLIALKDPRAANPGFAISIVLSLLVAASKTYTGFTEQRDLAESNFSFKVLSLKNREISEFITNQVNVSIEQFKRLKDEANNEEKYAELKQLIESCDFLEASRNSCKKLLLEYFGLSFLDSRELQNSQIRSDFIGVNL